MLFRPMSYPSTLFNLSGPSDSVLVAQLVARRFADSEVAGSSLEAGSFLCASWEVLLISDSELRHCSHGTIFFIKRREIFCNIQYSDILQGWGSDTLNLWLGTSSNQPGIGNTEHVTAYGSVQAHSPFLTRAADHRGWDRRQDPLNLIICGTTAVHYKY